MNILLNLIESEEGYYELRKLAFSNFGISSEIKYPVSKTQINESLARVNFDYVAPEVLN